MKKIIRNRGPIPIRQKNASSSLYDSTLAITYGTVDSNNDDGTTNILLVNGFPADNIRIPSSSYPTQDPVTGGVIYPPIGAEVAIIHPKGDINSGFIIPPGLNERNPDVVSALFGKGDFVILPGGWEFTYNKETGEAKFSNNSNDIRVDPGNGVIEIYGTTKVARVDDTTSLTMSGIDIQSLAAALLTTGAFVPASAPVPATSPVTFNDGKITSGSEKVKVG